MPKKTRKIKKTKKRRKTIAYRLCSCIKGIQRKTRKSRKRAEADAIRICVNSVVNRKGKRLRSFTCKKRKGGPSIRFVK